jgi:tRNA(fMet)-specific endonuclease VapC
MALYVLDTDTFTLFREGHDEVNRRVQAHPPAELATSVITVEEQLTGWYSLVRRARTPEQLEMAYRELAESVQFCSQVQILPYTQAAIGRFEGLRALRLNVGAMDLRIAAIVLEAGATLVTRNLRDFRRIPGLMIEDWTQP